jgi:hypothetical protein
MKKGFLNAALGVMLFAPFCTGAVAQSNSAFAHDKQKKEKVQVIVVEKKGRGNQVTVTSFKSRATAMTKGSKIGF